MITGCFIGYNSKKCNSKYNPVKVKEYIKVPYKESTVSYYPKYYPKIEFVNYTAYTDTVTIHGHTVVINDTIQGDTINYRRVDLIGVDSFAVMPKTNNSENKFVLYLGAGTQFKEKRIVDLSPALTAIIKNNISISYQYNIISKTNQITLTKKIKLR